MNERSLNRVTKTTDLPEGNRQLSMLPSGAVFLRCSNGTFVGTDEAGVEEYRGIPFALPPTGERRWKAPVPAPDGDGIFEAFANGKSPIQTECESEQASYFPQGEDCLYLNLWMGEQGMYGDHRPVMVFFHGGAYGWGGTADPMYDGTHFVTAHPEIVLITVAYRTGLMGFVDFSYVPGGEAFPDSANLGILDQIEALRWVKKNCEAFGGDPENITIFGESAGGGSVSLLPLIPSAKGLFSRVIAQSGSVALTYSKEQCRLFTDRLLEQSGAVCMEDLLTLSEEELKELNEHVNEYANFPQRDGKLIPVDPYLAYKEGASREVDLLIGTNANELNYWIGEVGGVFSFGLSLPVKFENDIKPMRRQDKRRVKEFMRTRDARSIFRMSQFYSETMFRLPAILQAGEHAANGGKAFMYYWNVWSKIPYYRACHAVELSYVFGNLDNTIYTGEPADRELSRMIQQMWVNFATCGDPSLPELSWPEYDKKRRATLVFTENPHVEEDPKSSNRKLLYPLLKYRINPSYMDLNLNTHFVRRVAGALLLATGGIVAGLSLLVAALVKEKE